MNHQQGSGKNLDSGSIKLLKFPSQQCIINNFTPNDVHPKKAHQIDKRKLIMIIQTYHNSSKSYLGNSFSTSIICHIFPGSH